MVGMMTVYSTTKVVVMQKQSNFQKKMNLTSIVQLNDALLET